MDRGFTSGVGTRIAEVGAVALVWIALFNLNHWLFSRAEIGFHISWIFLPAALRILSVLMLDWSGVAGLFLGAFLTNFLEPRAELMESLALSAISALSPLVAVQICRHRLNIAPDLAGLTFRQLSLVAIAGAITSSLGHNLYFHLTQADHDWLTGMLPMLAGDTLGSFLLLYLCAAALRRIAPS